MTILAALLALSPYVDIHARIDLPIPQCTPEIVGVDGKPLMVPPAHPLVFHFLDTPVRLIIASTCHEPRWICLDWQVVCDSDCVFAVGGRTKGRSELGEDAIVFSVPLRCWGVTEEVVFRVEYHASAMGDLDGSCTSDAADVRILAGLQNRNRLAVFAEIQNEWWVGTPSAGD